MRRNPTLFAGALAAIFQLVSPAHAQEPTASPWCADFDVAMKRAQKEGKNLLVDFTGSDWCGWCMKLDEEVFQKKEFLDAVKDKFVLVALDYPRKEPAKSKVPNPERNAEVASMYGVGGYPTVLLLTPEGDMFGQTGYEEGGPVNYVNNLLRLEHEGEENLQAMRSLQRTFKKAKSKKHRIEVVRSAVNQLAQMTRQHYGVRGVARIAANALKLDKRNKQKLKNAAIRAIIMAGVAEADVLAEARKDKKNKQGLYELLAADAVLKALGEDKIRAAFEVAEAIDKMGFKDKTLQAFVMTNVAIWADEVIKDPAKAKAFAKKALAAGVGGAEYAKLKKIADK